MSSECRSFLNIGRAFAHGGQSPIGATFFLAFCASRMNYLNIREREFLRSIAQWRGNLTERQHQWLEAIADKLQNIR